MGNKSRNATFSIFLRFRDQAWDIISQEPLLLTPFIRWKVTATPPDSSPRGNLQITSFIKACINNLSPRQPFHCCHFKAFITDPTITCHIRAAGGAAVF